MTDMPFSPTPEQVAEFEFNLEDFGDDARREDIIELMANAVRRDRRQRLARRAAAARNYSYEAMMSDYPIDSIHRADYELSGVGIDANREGWTLDDLTTWDDTLGHWRPVIS